MLLKIWPLTTSESLKQFDKNPDSWALPKLVLDEALETIFQVILFEKSCEGATLPRSLG